MRDDQQLEETINKTNRRTRSQERRPRRKNRGDLIKMRIDGISTAVNPDIVRKFCSAFGEVSAAEVLSNSDGVFWAEVELREPEQYKRLWAEWLNPRILDGWRVQVESDDSESRIIVISEP
jgi:hypothetical protein